MTAVQRWTGAETKALREAMRLSVRAFAEHLGVCLRTVGKWEARGASITLLPDTQALMDTALRQAPDDVKVRFAEREEGADSPHPVTKLAGLFLAHLAATSKATAGLPADQQALIASLAPRVGNKPYDDVVPWVPGSDVFVVLLPQGGIRMPLSRRELLGALGVGIVNGRLHSQFERALDDIKLDSDLPQYFDDALNGFQEAARMLPSQQLIDGLLGNVAILDGLRRRTAKRESQRYGALQARYAESLSWLSEEGGDLPGAMYWIDRVAQWAQIANWSAMIDYSAVRRSMMAMSFSGDGRSTAEQAGYVLDIPDAAPRIKGLAATWMAFGYALAGDGDASQCSLDIAMDWLTKPVRGDDALLGNRSLAADDLFGLSQATCDIYLGHGEGVIPVLEPRLTSLSTSSVRMATITRARLARAYANAGQPAEACRLAWETLDAIEHIDSLTARSELHHTARVLDQWRTRGDVQDVRYRLGRRASII